MGQKYIVEKPITVRSAELILTEDQLRRREGTVKPAVDENGEVVEGVYVPSNEYGVQFKVGEIVEYNQEAEKVLLSNNQLREVSDSEAEEFLQQQEKQRAQVSPSEFQRRPVPDRSGSPNAQLDGPITDEELKNEGLSREEYDRKSDEEKEALNGNVQTKRKAQVQAQSHPFARQQQSKKRK